MSYPAYDGTPLPSFLSLNEGAEDVARGLDRISCPVLVVTSRQDHVVSPRNSDLLVAAVSSRSSRSEHVWLERSYHNAMVDYEHEEVEARLEEFVVAVTSEVPGGEGT